MKKKYRTESDGTPILDKPLLSPLRLVRAVRMWLWWEVVKELDFPLWLFLVYHERPYAAHKAGKY